MEAHSAFYRMTAFETAVGWIFGLDPTEPSAGNERSSNARHALESVIRDALLATGPTFIAFSGGRDSSAILALAVSLARREGIDPPVPVTEAYPGVAAASETEWQERVLSHLGVGDWIRIVHDGDDDLLGRAATQSLRQHGHLWPPTLHLKGDLFRFARGGTLLTGEGGDSLLGVRRITPLTGLLHGRVHPQGRAAVEVLRSLAPRVIRRRMLATEARAESARHWITTEAQDTYLRMAVADDVAEPLLWNRSIGALLRVRAISLGLRNMRILAASHQVGIVHPLRDPRFVEAWARQGGVLGFPGRTAAMEFLFANLLPPEVLRRPDKARFNAAFVGKSARAWIQSWPGDGVDPSLVDAESLRKEILSERPHAASLPLLHAVWLRAQHAYERRPPG